MHFLKRYLHIFFDYNISVAKWKKMHFIFSKISFPQKMVFHSEIFVYVEINNVEINALIASYNFATDISLAK